VLGLPRQNVNYHLRSLEEHGLVHLVEERPRRGLTERVLVATARSYVVSPQALGATAADPTRTDRLSTRYLVAIAARMVREVIDLARRADAANQQLATLAIDTELRFASAAERAAFTTELSAGSPRSSPAITTRLRPAADGTAWEPPHRIVFDGGEDAGGLAFEWLVEARGGGTCIVRLVNSGFGSGEEWDGQYDAMTEGWQLFLLNLKLHLEHFAGQNATSVLPTALWAGPRRLALVLDTPAPGTAFLAAEGVGDHVGVSIWSYLYGPESAALAARELPKWQQWLDARAVQVSS
jgi:DNA-binding transcriptional ArsR family regulator